MATSVRSEKMSTYIMHRIVNNKINAPTLTVLYVNFMIALFWLLTIGAYEGRDVIDYTLSAAASLALLGACIGATYGVFKPSDKVVSRSSVTGYIAWVLAFMMWILDEGKLGNVTIPLFTIPMILFFAHAHLRRVVENE